MATKKGKLSDLTPDRRNANRGTQRGLKALDHSLRQYGAGRSILIDKNGNIIAGNKTVERAADIGLDDVIIVQTDGHQLVAVQRTDLDLETDKAARELAYADNRVGQLDLDWEPDELKLDLDAGLDLSQFFTDKELADLGVEMEQPKEDPGAQIDRAEELREKWGVEPGQLWRLGEHRLICGDCTDRAVVERVMGGERVSLIVTDPPYGVDYDGGANNERKREKLEGDKDSELYAKFLDVAPIDGKCALYMWHDGRLANEVYQAANGAGFEIRTQIIWHKLKAHYGAWMAQYKQKHEPCIYCVKNGPEFSGATNEVTVWEYDQPSRNENHPTEKPVELMERAIGNHPYILVYEPFSGSGTTLIACERLRRKCRAVEISPAYCAVTIQRWVDMTGGTPELVHT